MYGRFNEAIPMNFATGDVTNVAYARYGWGTMIGIGKSKHHVDLILFKAKDDTSSVHTNPDSIKNIKPQENLVLGIITSNQIGDNINLKFEYTTSYLTTDITSPARKFSGISIANLSKSLFTPFTQDPKTYDFYFQFLNEKIKDLSAEKIQALNEAVNGDFYKQLYFYYLDNPDAVDYLIMMLDKINSLRGKTYLLSDYRVISAIKASPNKEELIEEFVNSSNARVEEILKDLGFVEKFPK